MALHTIQGPDSSLFAANHNEEELGHLKSLFTDRVVDAETSRNGKGATAVHKWSWPSLVGLVSDEHA
ncbi:hypothetical protein FKM82_008496 [Ascaphus truei]